MIRVQGLNSIAKVKYNSSYDIVIYLHSLPLDYQELVRF